jgi:hypothetical protein
VQGINHVQKQVPTIKQGPPNDAPCPVWCTQVRVAVRCRHQGAVLLAGCTCLVTSAIEAQLGSSLYLHSCKCRTQQHVLVAGKASKVAAAAAAAAAAAVQQCAGGSAIGPAQPLQHRQHVIALAMANESLSNLVIAYHDRLSPLWINSWDRNTSPTSSLSLRDRAMAC